VPAVNDAAITTGHVTEFRMPRIPFRIVMENPDALFDGLHAFLNAH
jgi:hypothetical protein